MSRNPSDRLRSRPFAACAPDLGSGAARRGGSSPSSCTRAETQRNRIRHEALEGKPCGAVDDSVDTSSRGKAIADLTEALRTLLAEGDGEGARVVIRALEELARLVTPTETARAPGVTELQVVRKRDRERA